MPSIYFNYFKKAMLETERRRIEQLTAGWEDPTQVDWGNVHAEEAPTTKTPTYKCTALYSYTVRLLFYI